MHCPSDHSQDAAEYWRGSPVFSSHDDQVIVQYLERDRESTFSVLRGTAAEKSVSDEWNKEERDEDEGNEEGDKEEEEPAERLILAGSTANHPEERPPPEPDPSLHDRLTHRSHNYCETSHSILQFL